MRLQVKQVLNYNQTNEIFESLALWKNADVSKDIHLRQLAAVAEISRQLQDSAFFRTHCAGVNEKISPSAAPRPFPKSSSIGSI